jgi:processive 1,2-diacylglycerol beta-glucosyltransferase
MPEKPRILILTAAFGEGHNSAARNLSLALDALGADTRVADPCVLSAPNSTALVQWGYRLVTTHFPKVWEAIYRGTDQCDFSRPGLPFMHQPESYLEGLVAEYRPDAIASTYPIYPYFLDRHFAETGKRLPVFTVVTDSIEINASWLRAPTDHFLVTDSTTLETMRRWGIPAEKMIDTGFPVNPAFSELAPVPADDPCEPFRVLYFPTANKPSVSRHSRALLVASPDVHLTIVMGKNFRLLQSRAREIKAAYPGRVRLLGWTRKVPQLLNKHHMVIGKAGGATVHEAIAARCPMLIHHLVPGQEEGNLRLLQQLGAGDLAERPRELTEAVTRILADNAAKWRAMKAALAAHNRNDGAITAAKFILKEIEDRGSRIEDRRS